MHPSEAMAALAANERLGIVLDRRRLDGERMPPPDLKILAEIEVAATDTCVLAALVTASNGGTLPRRDGELSYGQIRLMDRFYLPAIREQTVIAPMFDMAAEIYDKLTNRRLNLQTASLLLRTVLADAGPEPIVLDFGCGTGVAFDALTALALPAILLGVDLSEAMLARAKERGLAVMRTASWRLDPPPVDGAIANFVLHYGVPATDLSRIASSLRPNGRFAGNVFGAEPKLIERITDILESEGLVLEARTALPGTSRSNLLLSFRKPQ